MKFIQRYNQQILSLQLAIICFLTYACVYAFRKPFTIGIYENAAPVFGVEYKNMLVIAQVLGYTISKFYGIKYIAELKKTGRGYAIITLILCSLIPLLCFPYVTSKWSVFCLFLNGLPLGVLWGLVFSYVEGRRFTDFIGAAMAVSFIVSSGFVKSVGKWLQIQFTLTDQWIPFYTGLLFLLPLCVLVFLLEKMPLQSQEDEHVNTKRVSMNHMERKKFYQYFGVGLFSFVLVYLFLTIFRDVRDNFMAELWAELGYHQVISLFTTTEIPIALFVLALLASMTFLKNHQHAFFATQYVILLGFVICGVSTFLFLMQWLSGFYWIVLVGLGLYMGYIPFNSILFDRMIASFKIKGNVGYFMYLVDAFGYLGSVCIILLKGILHIHISWVQFFSYGLISLSIFGIIACTIVIFYFSNKYKTVYDE